jgi:PAS domain S-box-containing protein
MKTLVIMNDEEERTCITHLLREHFNAETSERITDIEWQFDLCILDETALKRLAGTIRQRKMRDMPLSLPFLLITSGENVSVFSEYAEDLIDEIICTPLNLMELRMRIGTLMRIRRLTCEAEQNYYSTMVSSPIGIVLVQDNCIVYNNQAFSCLFGIEPSAMVHSCFENLFHPDERERLIELCDECSARHDSSLQTEATMLCGKGERTVELYITSTVYKGSDSLLVNIIDVTEQKHLQEQFYQAQKMEAVGRLAGGIAHDFNNVISAILCYSSLIMELLGDKDAVRNDILEIVKAGERASALSRQLMTFSRKKVLQIRRVAVNDLVSNLEKLLRHIIGEDIKLKTVLDPDVRDIMADSGQMEQIIMNLVINARDAMPDGGTIMISTESRRLTEHSHVSAPPGDYLCLSIMDTGTGIDEQTMEHVFEPFFTTKSEDLGTGLGLSIVYAIVEQHRGFVNVESRMGEGSTFKIFIPFSDAALSEDSAPSQQVENAAENLKDLRILYIEDEEMVARCSSRVLQQEGCIVYNAQTAREAEEIFNRENGEFHLVLTDVVLPDKAGPRLVEELRAINPALKVVFSSGYADEKTSQSLIENESYGFLHKPYCGRDLLAMIRNIAVDGAGGGAESLALSMKH